MLRDIGHNLENFHHLQGENKHTGEKQEKKTKKHMRGGEAPQGTGTEKKRTQKQASEWRNKDSELAGISAELLEERKKADVCLKYGKGMHKWYEYWSKSPVTTKVMATKRQQGGKKKDKKKEKKDVKILAVRANEPDEHGGRIIELMEDSDGDYGLLV